MSAQRGGVLVATVLWQRLDAPGIEHFILRRDASGPHLQGTVIVVEDGTPMRLDYEVQCSASWETRSVDLTLVVRDETRRLKFAVDEQRRWRANGEDIAAVAGLANVDLSITPATNTLHFNHGDLLHAPIGESREVTAAWVLFPEMRIEPLFQSYTRIGELRFAYESLGGEFTTEIAVDEFGLVVSYPPFWTRVRT